MEPPRIRAVDRMDDSMSAQGELDSKEAERDGHRFVWTTGKRRPQRCGQVAAEGVTEASCREGDWKPMDVDDAIPRG
ncbi:hypothetical protein CR159_09960 [Pollutimonas subterranea]|uniref:Uncharacterized protein n=1 Tax=Pollutimonas subterranea TaxID=2045210 RepID=A0A2N4U4N1_9BURK|nr:hypothetical protein [Pollutimonas subterranea]PLC49963.1 hypothetical protein CR159_09960 [Pollutimonas subterranea]